MDATIFRQKLREHIDLEYERLREKRKLEKSFEGLNIWEESFQKTEHAENILLEYIETLKYTKKRWFGKSRILYKEVKACEFRNFYLEKRSKYSGHVALSEEQNFQRYMDFMAPLKEAYSILNKILNQHEKSRNYN